MKVQAKAVEDAGTGRAPLARAYRVGADGDRTLRETAECLRRIGARDLTSPDKMGERFKFVSMFPNTMADIHQKYPPVGFETT